MSVTLLILIILGAVTAAYVAGLARVRAVSGGNARVLHSRPSYYGTYVALVVALAAFSVMAVWLIAQGPVIMGHITDLLPADVRNGDPSMRELALAQVVNVAQSGSAFGAEPYAVKLAATYNSMLASSRLYMTIAVLLAALVAFALAYRQVRPQARARNWVEAVVKALLIICSSIAVLTTVGIVLSMLFQTIHFFSLVPPENFFFGLVWDPRFAAAGSGGETGQFGLIPVLWGTVFITILAMMVSVPVGLMSAIYLAEYAGPRFRGIAKPILEILAGIPTVVYGFFALITVGPFLRDGGALIGLDIDARSALTAGLVMGIMIIPFVSSLSDDVINAVPQSLRDGSYGLGATKSETIRRVILPAALPGIVGSIILAVSRAVGETMIVVMAAGVAANLTANPFQAVTTVTVKIVSQLTGDQEFTSPQTLVAFALGMTLFVITLILNVYALHIVRKYREQYD
ncbi:MAG: phosphate ABC transporter permease subunit PstC [Alphaproteobacteria bacterium]|nr:phosphate ABC transporter permease subunit PstC [Alphaproteobacteria bacterium]